MKHNLKIITITILLIVLALTFTITAFASDNPLEIHKMEYRLDVHMDNYTLESYTEEVVYYVNQVRARHGLAPVTLDADLSAAAMGRMLENHGALVHTRPDGTGFYTITADYNTNLTALAENIISASATPAWMAEAWFNSPGHRNNMLNEMATHTGIAVSFVDHGSYTQIYALQLFGR